MGLVKGRAPSGEGAYWPNVDSKREWVSNPFGQMCGAFSFGTTICEVKSLVLTMKSRRWPSIPNVR